MGMAQCEGDEPTHIRLTQTSELYSITRNDSLIIPLILSPHYNPFLLEIYKLSINK